MHEEALMCAAVGSGMDSRPLNWGPGGRQRRAKDPVETGDQEQGPWREQEGQAGRGSRVTLKLL